MVDRMQLYWLVEISRTKFYQLVHNLLHVVIKSLFIRLFSMSATFAHALGNQHFLIKVGTSKNLIHENWMKAMT